MNQSAGAAALSPSLRSRCPHLIACGTRRRSNGSRRSPRSPSPIGSSGRRHSGRVRSPVRGDGGGRHAAAPVVPRSARIPTSPGPTRPTLPGSKTAPSSAREHEDDAGPTNNWMAPARDAHDARPACSTAACAAARCTWCRSRMGPLGSHIAQIGVETHRLALRGRQHAHHDPHGPGGARRARRRRRVRRPACTRWARRWRRGPGRRRRGPATTDQVHRPLSRDPRDLVATARATAATRCWARSASRCASPRPWAATRAGWPSTC
jgi:hypothetical protein